MTTPTFTPAQVKKYAETRLFGENVTPEMVVKIQLYNGTLPSALEERLQTLGKQPRQVQQENGREPIYYTPDRTLHIPQYSGFGRRRRYEEMIFAS